MCMLFPPAMFHSSDQHLSLLKVATYGCAGRALHTQGVPSLTQTDALQSYAEQTHPALHGSLLWPDSFLSLAGNCLLKNGPWINSLHLPDYLLLNFGNPNPSLQVSPVITAG